MTLTNVANNKSAFPEKAGARTPTALLETKSMRQSTLTEYSASATCPTCGEGFDTPRAMKAHHQHHDLVYYDAVVEREFGITPAEFIETYHLEQQLTLEETGDKIGASNTAIKKMAKRHDVSTRGRSESKEVMWDRLDESEYDKFLTAPHEKTRELVEEGDHIFQDESFERVLSDEFLEHARSEGISDGLRIWMENNSEKLSEFASQGADGRERNWMTGRTGQDHPRWNRVETECANCGETIHRKPSRAEAYDELYCGQECAGEHRSERFTGQDHPNWRGGSSVINAIKKQLRPSFSVTREIYREAECQQCGVSDSLLDAHHIVPVSAGGTNEGWNLMTLCRQCHSEVEWFTRQFPGFDPVLIE